MIPVLVSSRKHNGKDGWKFITPVQAAQLLESSTQQRPLIEFRARAIAADISASAWRPNGESLVFDDKGRAIDCQHRLRACVLANKTIEAYCVFDVPSTYFASFDQGKARSGSDLAALLHFKNYVIVSAMARIAIDHADGMLGKQRNGRLANETIRLFLTRHRDRLAAAADAIVKHQHGIRKLTPLSHVGFVFYVTVESNPAKALEFLDKLSSGVGLAKGDSILLFRDRMTKLDGDRHVVKGDHKLALLIKAWNSFVRDEHLKCLKWNAETEAFPVFV